MKEDTRFPPQGPLALPPVTASLWDELPFLLFFLMAFLAWVGRSHCHQPWVTECDLAVGLGLGLSLLTFNPEYHGHCGKQAANFH